MVKSVIVEGKPMGNETTKSFIVNDVITEAKHDGLKETSAPRKSKKIYNHQETSKYQI